MSVRVVKVSSNCAHVMLLVSTGFRHKEKSARCAKASRSSLTVTSLPFLVMLITVLSNAQESNAGRPHPAHTWLNSDLENEEGKISSLWDCVHPRGTHGLPRLIASDIYSLCIEQITEAELGT